MTAEPSYQLVTLDRLHESPLNPRKHWDPAKLKELTASVKEHGVLTPILVRPNAKGFEIAAGHRRFRAAKSAGLETVPAVIRVMTDTEFLEVLTIENLQREDIHPLEEADGYRALMDKAGYDVETIAAKVGKSVSYVYQRLKLADLVAPARKEFLGEAITAGHAILLARLQPKDQAAALTRCFDDGYGYRQRGSERSACSVRDLSHWISEEIHLDLHAAPWKKDDATLVPAAGACTTCPKRTGANEALFPDIAKKDTCTDGACFQTKREAFVARQRTELEAKLTAGGEKGAKLVELSTLNRYEQPRAKGEARGLPAEGWHRATKKCKHPVAGLIVEGRSDIGQTVQACTDTACPSLGREISDYRAASAARSRSQAAAEKKRKAEMQTRRALLRGVLAKAPPRPGDDELRLIGRRYLVEMHRDDLVLLGKVLGVVDEKPKGWADPAPAIRRIFEKEPIAKVTQALLGCALIGATNSGPYVPAGGKGLVELEALAKRYKAKPIEAVTPAVAKAVKGQRRAR